MDTTKSILSDEEFDVTAEFQNDSGSPANPTGNVTAVCDDTTIAAVIPVGDGRKWTVRATGQFDGICTVTISDDRISAKVTVDVKAVGTDPTGNATNIVLTTSEARKKTS